MFCSENIGKSIKELRKATKMTQSDLAVKINVTKSAVSAYENDLRLPSYEILVNIAEIFGVSIDNIFGRSNKYSLDVTGLSVSQIVTMKNLVKTYKAYNSICSEQCMN